MISSRNYCHECSYYSLKESLDHLNIAYRLRDDPENRLFYLYLDNIEYLIDIRNGFLTHLYIQYKFASYEKLMQLIQELDI